MSRVVLPAVEFVAAGGFAMPLHAHEATPPFFKRKVSGNLHEDRGTSAKTPQRRRVLVVQPRDCNKGGVLISELRKLAEVQE